MFNFHMFNLLLIFFILPTFIGLILIPFNLKFEKKNYCGYHIEWYSSISNCIFILFLFPNLLWLWFMKSLILHFKNLTRFPSLYFFTRVSGGVNIIQIFIYFLVNKKKINK